MKKSHKILVLGSGGRENALAWKLAQSDHCEKLYLAPGNAGSATYAETVDLSVSDFESIKAFCIKADITMLIPGPEEPLVLGIVDFFKADEQFKELIICGPSAAAAQLEGSKAFSKRLMNKYGIPTAAYREFNIENYEEGMAYLKTHTLPIVIKADGLAAGKGVVIAQTLQEAEAAFMAMIKNQQFGVAGSRVVVEEFLSGLELSVFVLCHGDNYIILPTAKDYKRIGEGDTGLNTGGMGAISPVPFARADFMDKVHHQIIVPTLKGMIDNGTPYQGFLFLGLIKVGDEPFVIEYNCRLGDPETEVILPRLENDLVLLIEDMHHKELKQEDVHFAHQHAATVMLVSGGYPEDYEKGEEIKGLENTSGCILFHAGTRKENEKIVTAGGRVLAVTGMGTSLVNALKQCYAAVGYIQFRGMNFRKDIGFEFKDDPTPKID